MIKYYVFNVSMILVFIFFMDQKNNEISSFVDKNSFNKMVHHFESIDKKYDFLIDEIKNISDKNEYLTTEMTKVTEVELSEVESQGTEYDDFSNFLENEFYEKKQSAGVKYAKEIVALLSEGDISEKQFKQEIKLLFSELNDAEVISVLDDYIDVVEQDDYLGDSIFEN